MLRDPSLIPLSHQHQHGLALCVLIDRGLKADLSDATASRLQRQLAVTVKMELRHHFKVEEEILFPIVRNVIESPELVDDLVAQHREMETLALSIEEALGETRIALLREFGGLLSRHIRTEERYLFQEVQAKLPARQLAGIGRKIDESLSQVCPANGSLPWEDNGV